MSRFQGTVTKEVNMTGIGLHSGRPVELRILPATPNHGIYFCRTDLPNQAPIFAHPLQVSATQLSTTLGPLGAHVATVEHLMAAFAGVGIDNAIVWVDGPEIPILDGSSAPFVEKFLEVGVQIQNVRRKQFLLSEPFEVRNGDQYVRYEPWGFLPLTHQPALLIEGHVEYASDAIGRQTLTFPFSHKNFLSLQSARTFCHVDDIEQMQSRGLAKGGSLHNAIVVDGERVLNPDGLRCEDEFIRHKILDFIGDIALLGGQLVGKVTLHKGGHRLHVEFAQESAYSFQLDVICLIGFFPLKYIPS
jgi:UDP-3-O-[3-hydroxymyristoyl] N-acetylglucosamine deacetylase